MTSIISQRNRLIEKHDTLGAAIRKAPSEIKGQTVDKDTLSIEKQASAAQEFLRLGRLYMSKFLETTDPKDFRGAITEL